MVFSFNGWRQNKLQRDGSGAIINLCLHGQNRQFNRRYVSKICRYFNNLSHKSSHDEMAKFLGVLAMPFDIMYPDKAKEIKRMVLDYIKVLRRAHFNNSQNIGDEITNGLQKNTIQIDDSGFPVAPRPHSWSKVKREDLELIYRLYMTCHYRKSLFISASLPLGHVATQCHYLFRPNGHSATWLHYVIIYLANRPRGHKKKFN